MEKDMKIQCNAITEMHMNSVLHIQEFRDALASYQGPLDDEAICEIVGDAARKMDIRHPKYRDALKSARRIHFDTFGTCPDDLYLKIWIPAGYRDLEYLIDMFSPINTYLIAYVMQDRLFLRTTKQYAPIETKEQLCSVLELVFYKLIHAGYKHKADPLKRYRYSVFKRVTMCLDWQVFQDSQHWRGFCQKVNNKSV